MKKSWTENILFFIAIIVLVAITVFSKLNIDDEEKLIAIHIKGAVNEPGYYELSYGSRIKDAIELAGGETNNADIEKVNLAMVLRDGEEIIIPKKDINKDD